MVQFEDYFSVQIFFIILRETVESAIIVSVLLSFLNQNFTKKDENNQTVLTIDKKAFSSLKFQIWFGGLLGLFICFCIGGFFVGVFYIIGNDLWSLTERLWEGVFSILSSIIISIMGVALLRINQMQIKWRFKLSKSLNFNKKKSTTTAHSHASSQYISIILEKFKNFTEKYFLGILPFVTTLREGLEAVVFIGGIGVNQPLTSFPLAIICGAALGGSVGVFLYRGGNKLSLQYFLVGSTCFLYLVSAGLMSRGVWFLELEQYVRNCGGQDMSEIGSGPGSYDISKSVWHVNCCNGLKDGGWMLFNALLGWTNSATYGSVISYNLYWVTVIIILRIKLYEERYGYIPLIPYKWQLKKIKRRVAFFNIKNSQGVFGNYDDISSTKSDSIDLLPDNVTERESLLASSSRPSAHQSR